MRGTDATTVSSFSRVDLDERLPARHPLPTIRQAVIEALASVDANFDRLGIDDRVWFRQC